MESRRKLVEEYAETRRYGIGSEDPKSTHKFYKVIMIMKILYTFAEVDDDDELGRLVVLLDNLLCSFKYNE